MSEFKFFFSYKRSDSVDKYLERFFGDLDTTVRLGLGLPQRAEGVLAVDQHVRCGFLDWRNIELGEEWDPAIVQALEQSKVLVTLCSPGYFKSDYCGKEVALFAHLHGGVARVKPAVWFEFDIDEAPPCFQEKQAYFGKPDELHNTKGFLYLLKQLQKYETEYNDAIDRLATIIIKAVKAEASSPLLPPVGPRPKLADIEPWPMFGATSRGVVPPTGPKHVRFVYVAADPHRFGPARSGDAYKDAGGGDWRPFWPDFTARIAPFTQNIVSGDSLDFSSQELPFTANLVAEIEGSLDRREIVVLIVDGWSLQWDPEYRAVLRQLDTHLDYHWCVLVPWNEHDPDSMSKRAEIEETLRATFDRHLNYAPKMFYRDDIRSPEDLKEVLGKTVAALKKEILTRAPVSRPVPTGVASLPTVTGPGKQG